MAHHIHTRSLHLLLLLRLQLRMCTMFVSAVLMLLHVPPGAESAAQALLGSGAAMFLSTAPALYSSSSSSSGLQRLLLAQGQSEPADRALFGIGSDAGAGNPLGPLAFPQTLWSSPGPLTPGLALLQLRAYTWLYVALLLLPLARAMWGMVAVAQVRGSKGAVCHVTSHIAAPAAAAPLQWSSRLSTPSSQFVMTLTGVHQVSGSSSSRTRKSRAVCPHSTSPIPPPACCCRRASSP